jgi:inhibitor of KinA sporulation pathway (predicted exonuclease)
VVDLEATTDDGEEHERAVPRDEMETIEIGAVLVQAPKFEIIGAFQTFVRPILHPTLTPFCTRLTGISQSMLVDAPSFPKALDALCQGMLRERDGVAWASWGMFDQTQLARDCALHQVAYPMPEHLNLKDLFSVTQGRRKRYGMKKALRLAGLTPQGVHHRALPDAMNAARLLPWIVGDKRIG